MLCFEFSGIVVLTAILLEVLHHLGFSGLYLKLRVFGPQGSEFVDFKNHNVRNKIIIWFLSILVAFAVVANHVALKIPIIG